MPHPDLGRWQRESGLDIDELALIQPQYVDAGYVAMASVPGMLALLAGIVGARISHAVRRLRFRFADTTPSLVGLIFAMVTAIAGWWLVAQARWAMGLPDVADGNLLGGALRDAAYGMVVWLVMAAGALGVVFGLAMVLRRVASVSTWRSRFSGSNLDGLLNRGTSQLIRSCLAIISPLVWAYVVTTIAQSLPPSVFCAVGRPLRSQWLPLPHRECLLEGQVVATSYADALFMALALAPIVWVIARAVIRVQPLSRPEAASRNITR